jgi:methylamine---glutamate N-methyltransferase subunit A
MCGIVGLHLKTDRLEGRLGALAAGMLACMAERGPDSAGLALYGTALPEGTHRYSVRAERPGLDWDPVAERLGEALESHVTVERRAGDAVLVADGDSPRVVDLLRGCDGVRLVGYGRALEVYKDVGGPGRRGGAGAGGRSGGRGGGGRAPRAAAPAPAPRPAGPAPPPPPPPPPGGAPPPPPPPPPPPRPPPPVRWRSVPGRLRFREQL